MRIEHIGKPRAALACALLALSSQSIAQTYVVQRIGPAPAKGYADIHISKSAIAGQQIRLWWATLLNPDCTMAGTMTTEIVSPPRHGQASISEGEIYPEYRQPNPRVACDARKVPGKQAFYTASADFHGHDKVVIQNATSEGRIRRVIVDIDVR